MQSVVSAKKNNRGVVLYVTGIIAFVITLLFLGKIYPFPNAPGLSIALETPEFSDSDGKNTVVVDNEGHRVLIMNSRNELIRVISYDVRDRPLDAVIDVCVTKGTVYVGGVLYEEETDIIEKERVMAYGLYNSPGVEVFSIEHEEDTSVPQIKSLSDGEGDVIIAVMEEDAEDVGESFLKVFRANRDEVVEYGSASMEDLSVFDAGVDLENGIVTVSQRGVANDDMVTDVPEKLKDHFFTSIDVNMDGTVFVTEDTSKDVLIVEDDDTLTQAIVGSEFGFSDVHTNRRMVSACNRTYNQVSIKNLDTGETVSFTKVRLSGLMLVILAIMWLSRFYLAFLLVRAIVIRVRLALATGDSSGMGGFLTAIFIVVAVAATMGYNAYVSYQTSLTTRGQEIMTLADIVYLSIGDMGEHLETIDNRTKLHADGAEGDEVFNSLVSVAQEVLNVTFSATDNGIGTYFYLYGKDDVGVYCIFDSSLETVMGSSGIARTTTEAVSDVFEGNMNDELNYGRTLRDASMYRLVPVFSTDGERVVGVIEVGSRIRSFESRILDNLTENAVVMLVVLFVVYVCYVELRDCGRCMVEYMKLRGVHKKRDAVALLTRPYTFIITMLISCDAVISTLIGRQMLSGMGLAERGLLITLPAVMQGIGLVVGQVAYGSLGWRVSARRLVCGFCAILTVAGALTFIVVTLSDFWLYLLAKFMLGVPFGLLYTLGYSLPRQARDEEIRVMASGGVRRTDTSAAAMGTIMGGFMSRTLGNEWVYVLVVVGSIIAFAFTARLFLRHAMPLEIERRGGLRGLAALWTFFKQKDTIALVLFLMLPMILASGYSSLLFPVYSSNLGMSSSTISYMVVLGQLVVYVSIDTIDYLDATYGKWMVGVAALAMLAALFLLFSLNTSFTWAVIAIALVGVCTKTGDAWKALWTKQASVSGVALGRATGTMFAMRSVLLVVQPILLGALLNVDKRIAATLLGVICAVSVTVFVFLTRNSKMRI